MFTSIFYPIFCVSTPNIFRFSYFLQIFISFFIFTFFLFLQLFIPPLCIFFTSYGITYNFTSCFSSLCILHHLFVTSFSLRLYFYLTSFLSSLLIFSASFWFPYRIGMPPFPNSCFRFLFLFFLLPFLSLTLHFRATCLFQPSSFCLSLSVYLYHILPFTVSRYPSFLAFLKLPQFLYCQPSPFASLYALLPLA